MSKTQDILRGIPINDRIAVLEGLLFRIENRIAGPSIVEFVMEICRSLEADNVLTINVDDNGVPTIHLTQKV